MDQTLPLSMELIQHKQLPIGIDSGLILLYGIQGKNEVIVESTRLELQKGGILVINPFVHLTLDCQDQNILMMIRFSQNLLNITGFNARSSWVDCYVPDNSPGLNNQMDAIRFHCACLFQTYFQNTQYSESRIVAHASQIIGIFTDYYMSTEISPAPRENREQMLRFTRMMNHIHANWREPITLKEIAEREHLSIGYLTRLFKKYTGSSFNNYLTELRLQNSIPELMQDHDSITTISYNNGFRNVNAFIKAFKEKYGHTPNQYRKMQLEKKANSWNVLTEETVQEQDGIVDFLKYAEYGEKYEKPKQLPVHRVNITIRQTEEKQKKKDNWRRIVNIGYAKDGLLSEIQNRLIQAQQEIGFEYLRFHGILDEDMHVYHEDEDGVPFLDFSYVDLLLDFVLSIDLKPYIELSFMPYRLAKVRKRIYDRFSYPSPYTNKEKWIFLIKGLLKHLVERYGAATVKQWKFTTIGINICLMAGTMELEEYLDFYRTTYTSVKAVNRGIPFGGPGGFASAMLDSGWLQRFLEYSKENNCLPDFVCVQGYPYQSIEQDSSFLKLAITQSSAPAVLSGDESFTRTILKDISELLKKYDLPHLGIWIEEWNSTLWQRDLSSDTCYKSAWLVKNICENYSSAEALGYWLLSDFMEERTGFGSVFHGGYGLFTYNGIPKSGWRAMQLLKYLGDSVISYGDGWLAAKSNTGVQLIFYHYCHYDNLYRYRYKPLVDPQTAYRVFVEKGGLQFHIKLTELDEGDYEIQYHSITPEQGSSYDAWLKMGAPHYLRKPEIDYLNNISGTGYYIRKEHLKKEYTLDIALESHEVKLIILEKSDAVYE